MVVQSDPHHFQPISCQYDVVENPHLFTPQTSCICYLLAVTNGAKNAKMGLCQVINLFQYGHRLFPMVVQSNPHHFQTCQGEEMLENTSWTLVGPLWMCWRQKITASFGSKNGVLAAMWCL